MIPYFLIKFNKKMKFPLDKPKIVCYNCMARRKVSSVGRASALQAEGHRFEPCTFHQIHYVPTGAFPRGISLDGR